MANFDNWKEQRNKWKEERRRIRDEIRSKMSNTPVYMMGGGNISGRAWTGIFILLIGVVALLKVTNVLPPELNWLNTWPMFLIALGLFIGIRHNFRGGSWFVLLLIGGAFLAKYNFFNHEDIGPYIWPLILIVLGIFFIFRPHQSCNFRGNEKKNSTASDIPSDPLLNPPVSDSKEDYINATSIFGGTKKNILSKNFKGGQIVNIFGGTELNLSQADISGEAVIEMTTLFGGSKLVIPSNWTVKSDAAVIFGGIEDKRPVAPVEESNQRVLRIKGTVIFGGIDYKSY